MEMLPGITPVNVADSLVGCIIGHEMTAKYREQARVNGTFQAAKNLRKQGWSLYQARMILLGVL